MEDYFESGIFVASTDKWGKNVEKALSDRSDVIRIGFSDLRNSQIDWSKFSFEWPEVVTVKAKKKLRYCQESVIQSALNHFVDNDCGQLILNCFQ